MATFKMNQDSIQGSSEKGKENDTPEKSIMKKPPSVTDSQTPVRQVKLITIFTLREEEKVIVKKFAHLAGMEVCEHCDVNTTHYMTSCRPYDRSYGRAKYMVAIASRCYLVTYRWAVDSLAANKVLPEDRYICTLFEGPRRCKTVETYPFAGLAMSPHFLVTAPGRPIMEAIILYCGAHLIKDLEQCYKHNVSPPFPRICLFEDESQLSTEIINFCSENLILLLNFPWIYRCVLAYKIQPIMCYMLSSFSLTEEIIKAYSIPQRMLYDDGLFDHTLPLP